MLAAMLSASTAASSDVTTAPPDVDKTEFVRRVVNTAKLDLDIRVVQENTPYCAFASVNGGQYYIAVDPSCVGAPVTNGRYSPRAVAILCHEIGHIKLGHLLSSDSAEEARSHQLQADEFGARLFSQLGGSLTQAQAFVATLSENPGDPREPGRAARMEAVAKGWREYRAQAASLQPQSWEPEGQGPFHVCWQSFWMGSAATFLVVVFFMRR
jgi:hypothetical protein